MPPMLWSVERIRVAQLFEGRHENCGDVGALIVWATYTVDSLYYLADLNQSVEGHDPNTMNAAHIRWATGSAITSIDLCAAALGRMYCGVDGDREFSLRDLYPDEKTKKTRDKVTRRRNQLPQSALEWVDDTKDDERYKRVLEVRNPLTHARMYRDFVLGGPDHTRFRVKKEAGHTAHELVTMSCEIATKSVTNFLTVVEQL